MSIVIVYGNQGTGKTRRGPQLMKHYGCKRIVDDWDGETPLKDGDLALTVMYPPFSATHTRAVDIATAKAAICK